MILSDTANDHCLAKRAWFLRKPSVIEGFFAVRNEEDNATW